MKRYIAPVIFLAAAVLANAQEVKRVPPRPTVAVDGKTLYRNYCAVCHGADAKGNGPAAKSIQPRPNDLTMISKNNGGKFPEERVLSILKGDEAVAAHGSKEMPMWGPIFRNMSSNPSMAQTRIHALLDYIEQIQAK